MLASHATLLDSNAGAPIHPFVVEALFAFLKEGKGLGNPSSLHALGREASLNVELARQAVLKTFNASPSEWTVTFTSGGTEANQLAIRGVLESEIEKGTKPKWFVSPVEHGCVLDLIAPMKRLGVEVTELKVKPSGEVIIPESAYDEATLISAIGVNNETGVLTSHILSENKALSKAIKHTDYVAGWGKELLNLSSGGAPDLVALAGHKLGAISGVGALIHRKKIRLSPQLIGSQQNRLRGGTENLLGILTLRVLSERWEEVCREIQNLSSLRDQFETELKKLIPRVKLTANEGARAPHLSHFSIPGLPKSLSLVQQLDLRGFAVSSGSACASHTIEPSHVLLAIGFNKIDALNSLRVSLHPGSTWKDLSGLLAALESILKRNEVI